MVGGASGEDTIMTKGLAHTTGKWHSRNSIPGLTPNHALCVPDDVLAFYALPFLSTYCSASLEQVRIKPDLLQKKEIIRGREGGERGVK